MSTQTRLGATIGRAIARDVLADGMPHEWTGLDAQDGDELTAAGILPGTTEWAEAAVAAKATYDDAIAQATADKAQRKVD